MGRRLALAGVVVVLGAAAPAQAQTGFWSLLPSGQGETVDALGAAAYLATGATPTSFGDQRALFEALPAAAPDVATADLGRFLKPAPIGAPAGSAAESPRPGVTIVRDGFNVPHVKGDTRADVMWGAGWASARDRLFFMDVLRHTARGRLTEMIGPGADGAVVAADAEQLAVTDYTDDELRAMVGRLAGMGEEGARAAADIDAYLGGVNAYVGAARSDSRLMPGEYALLGKELRPFTTADVGAIAGLINGYFGRGGGRELEAALARVAANARFGAARAARVLGDFRAFDDPEAPTTVRKRFRFDDPGRTRAAAVALPDEGSVKPLQRVRGASAEGGGARSAPSWLARLRARGGRTVAPRASNAVLIGAGRSASGRALFTGNPQVDFFAPPIFMEIALEGPGIAARGGALPGLGPWVVIGRGRTYAWTVTTAQGDNTDVFAERLCDPGGGEPKPDATHYLRGGRCVAMLVRDEPLAWDPGPADLALDPSVQPYRATLHTERTVHGPVTARGTVGGKPVAFAVARSSYHHETDTAVALLRLNEGLSGPQAFQRAAALVTGSYNWFYADEKHIAYLQSGLYPRRARGTSPDLPNWGTGRWDWRGFDAAAYTSATLPLSRLPKAIDPPSGYLISWNNKQAPGWRASDWDWQYGPVHRSQRLERRVRAKLVRGGKLDLGGLVGILGDAGTADVRAEQVLPWLLRAIGRPSDPKVAEAVSVLRGWSGHRRDRDGDGVYDESAAVALMDAWFVPLAKAIYAPVLGDELIKRMTEMNPIDYTPLDGPDTWFYGWMGYVQRDMRALLNRPIKQPPSRVYCGRGSRARCRALLRTTLAAAADEVARRHGSLGGARIPATCPKTVPASCDQLDYEPAGAIEIPPSPWQDRGSFQQAVEVGAAHGG
jgi:acyl-homoserine lactone acylase PvdQ